MTLSCWMSRKCSPPSAASSITRRRIAYEELFLTMAALRPDLAAIAAMIRPGARVLDVGCGDGALLEHLKAKNVDGRGIEISQANVNACVARGLAVVQGDADTDLLDYPAQVFDAVIL